MKKMVDFFIKNSQWLIIVGGLITLIGTFLAYRKSEKESAKQTETLNSNLHLSQDNKALLKQNEENIKRIQQLSDKNVELSQTLSDNALHYYNYTTGKNSYCYVSFTTTDGEYGTFLLTQVGNNMLQDVKLEIGDMTNTPDFTPLKSIDDAYDWKESVNFGTLNPLTKEIAKESNSDAAAYLIKTKQYPINGKKYIKFIISISTVGHLFKETLEVSLNGAACYTSIKLNEVSKGLIFSKVEPGFNSQH